MMPQIARQGSSFKGCYLYYFHDKRATTSERVEWTHTRNMMSDDPSTCWRVMAYTAMHQDSLKRATGQRMTGAKLQKPVFAYSLAWHPEQNPSREEMLEAANQTIEVLGLTEHEVMMAAHRDEPHKHVHIIANTVNPHTGLVAKTSYNKRKLQDWATEYEREHGKIYCKMRDENYEKRKQGEPTKYTDPNVTGAWEQSKDAEGFKKLMEQKGYHLAHGRKRLVMVDPYGKTFNPTRILSAAYGKGAPDKFRERMAGIDESTLPTPADILAQRKLQQDKPDGTEVTSHADKDTRKPKRNDQNSQDEQKITNDNKAPERRPNNGKKSIYPIARIRRADEVRRPSPANDNKEAYQLWKERKQKAYKARVDQAMDSKVMSQYDERSDLVDKHARTILIKQNELEDFYQLKEKKREIKQLQSKLEHPSLIQKVVNRFLGGEEKIKQEIADMKASRDNAKERYDEQIKTLEKQRDEALKQLKLQQQADFKRLRQQFKQREPDEQTLSQQWQQVAHRKHHRSRSLDKGRDGPSYSR